jgi:hypothetical protein
MVSRAGARHHREPQVREVERYEQRGHLTREWEWLKKKLLASGEAKQMLSALHGLPISIRHYCALSSWNRSPVSAAPAMASAFIRQLMPRIDGQDTNQPVDSGPRLTAPVHRLGLWGKQTRVQG